ncbi:MAG: UDP-N-acetylmuramoyl-L-alanyl-D-glutamate--2,6-diaminopimelate ligase, partial [Acidobacteriota bacterium]|nr:UDP-N-acetylmuramoyl-L-alanyl-D-glutamate--2,6-diaminopimelate ligase [Acidobacteriota bacterium]
MRLGELLEGVPVIRELPAELLAKDVTGMAYNSRKVQPGYLFFAFSGAKTDGANFAVSAAEKGALAVVSDRPAHGPARVPWIQVPNGREALAVAARNFFGKPDERVQLTAVTGTNGKTTSSSLIDSILRAAGKTTALIGTIKYHLAGKVLPAVNTTPESLDLFQMFSELAEAGGTHATFEASSHALDLGRIYAMHIHTAAFTNFTRDHLDYHGTMEAYFAAKQLLFTPRSGPPPRFAVLNADDEQARTLQLAALTEVFWYGTHMEPPPQAGSATKETYVQAENVDSSFNGLRFEVVAGARRFKVASALVGHINVSNILLACATAFTYGLS